MIPRDFDDQIEEPKAEGRPVVYAVAPSYAALSLPETDWAWDGVRPAGAAGWLAAHAFEASRSTIP